MEKLTDGHRKRKIEISMANNSNYDKLDEALAELDVDTNVFEDEPATMMMMTATTTSPERRSPSDEEAAPLTLSTNAAQEAIQDFSSGTKHLIIGCIAAIALVLFIVLILPTWLLIVSAVGTLIFLAAARLTMPSRESFHVKQEMKKIKKEKLSTNPNKSNWIGRKVATVKNVLSTEAKDAVGGYDDAQFWDAGVFMLVAVRDLTNGKCYAWIGLLNKWRSLNTLSPESTARIHRWLWNNSRGASIES